MSEEMKQQTVETPAEAPEAQAQTVNLSRKRRTALVGYLAILFAVAFLLVALSMVIENKRLQSSKEQLEDKSKQTSATLNGKIAELQASYDALQEKSAAQQKDLDALTVENQQLTALADQVPALEQALTDLTAERDGLQTDLDTAAAEKEALEAELDELRTQNEALSGKAEDAVRVSELLHQAMAADEAGDLEELQSLLDQIEPLEELLSETEREIYEELKIA